MDFVFDETKLVMPIVTLQSWEDFVQNIGKDGHYYFEHEKSYVQSVVMRLNNVTQSFYSLKLF